MTVKGTVIDKAYLLGLPGYLGKKPEDIAQQMLAAEALKNQGTNQKEIMDLVNAYKQEYGNGVSTLVCFYNATGYALNFKANYDKSGHIGKYPYDHRVENGQWSGFLHVKTSGAARGSVAGVQYTVENTNYVYTLAWSTPWVGDNSCWTQIIDNDSASTIEKGVNSADDTAKRDNSDSNKGYVAKVSIGNNSSPSLQGVVRYS